MSSQTFPKISPRGITKLLLLGVLFVCLFPLYAQTQNADVGALYLKATTKQTPRATSKYYGPKSNTVMWITNSQGKWVRTIGLWGRWYIWTMGIYEKSRGKSEFGLQYTNWDGTSGATRNNHSTITGRWDLKDSAGFDVPQGKYYYHIEMNETNFTWYSAYLNGEINIGPRDTVITGYKVQKDTNAGHIFDVVATYTAGGPDKRPPRIASGNLTSQKKLRLNFSEAIETSSATDLKNYSLVYQKKDSKGVVLPQKYSMSITSIALVPGTYSVDLNTENHYSNEVYTLIVQNILDKAETPNKLLADTLAYTYDKTISMPITENLPKSFVGLPVGDSVKTSFIVYDPPANILSSNFEVKWYDLDDTLESALYLNGGTKKIFASPKGIADNGESLGDVEISPSLLKEGINTVTIKFNSNLGGKTSGFQVLGMNFEYQLGVYRDLTNNTPSKNQASIKPVSWSISYLNGQYRLEGLDKTTIQKISIFNSSGKLLARGDVGSKTWNGKTNHGKEIRDALVYVKVSGKNFSDSKTLVIK